MLAVLPFENLSGDQRQEYFGPEFTAELTTELGRLHPESLGVIGPDSARNEKGKSIDQIKRDLRVQYVLGGSVTEHSGNEVRINAQLTQVSDQTQVWADSYSRSEMVGIAAGLDEKDDAFRWLNQAVQDRCDYVVYLKHEPGLDNLRADPRFDEIIRRIGLTP